MALITCPECSHSVSSMAISCPNCGYPVNSPSNNKRYQNKPHSARRKHPKLPNGYGSIKKLSGNRSNPYSVHPPTTEFTADGVPLTPPAICYAPDWYTGFYALQSWRNGTFDESTLAEIHVKDTETEYSVVSKIISAYNTSTKQANGGLTFAQVYDKFFAWKFERLGRDYSASTKSSIRAGYKNCAILHDRIFSALTTADLQGVVDNCPLKHASKELIVNLYHQMYQYANMENLCEKDYSAFVTINTPDDDESGVPFSESEIDILWNHADNNTFVQGILIMIYSGFRISAYRKLEINFEEHYFKGGVKTRNSKGRIVPFSPLVEQYINPKIELFQLSSSEYRKRFAKELSAIGLNSHTPHDCRHTFSWLCDKYKVDGLSKKMLMGHSLGNDITDNKYGHRTLEELREEISRIKHW